MKKHISGFTLIELLVVVAIIGILISLSFPVMSRVQESARRSAARMDAQSIVTAVNQYHSEYRRLPLTPDIHSYQGDEDEPPNLSDNQLKAIFAILQGGNVSNLNPRETQFLHLQEGRRIGHFMDTWSQGYRIEDHADNRLYEMLFDHNLNGRIIVGEPDDWKVIVTGQLVVVRSAGPNRRIDRVTDENFDDVYSIDVEQIERSQR